MTDHHPKLSVRELERLQEELARLKRDHIRQKLALLEAQAAEIVVDARRYQALEPVLPWETVLLGPERELASLVDKYDFGFMRSRPDPDDVSAATDLFFEALELLYTLKRTEIG